MSDYPVTTPYGQVADYPLNNGFHNGIDYGYPMNTPVVVNGVTIGFSNNTGASTGPHLHVGKYINGQVQDPGTGNGFHFSSAVVFDTGSDATNGNFVRITGDGALWNYLHLASTSVIKGQQLKGEDMPTVANKEFVQAAYQIILGRDASQVSQEEINAQVGKQVDTLFFELAGSAERDSLNKEVITDFFKGALQRSPTSDEITGWLNHGLKTQAEGITGSDEAKAVTAKYQGSKNIGTLLAPGTYQVK